MRFNLTLFPLDADMSVGDSAADIRAQFDGAGLRYKVTGSDTIVDAGWDQLAPVLNRADEALRLRHNRVCMVLSVEKTTAPANGRGYGVAAVERDSRHAIEL